jgi:hypothetical protein
MEKAGFLDDFERKVISMLLEKWRYNRIPAL